MKKNCRYRIANVKNKSKIINVEEEKCDLLLHFSNSINFLIIHI